MSHIGIMQYPRPNHNSAAEYQVAGIPFVTSSATDELIDDDPVKISFPYVSQWIMIQSIGKAPLAVGFTENGVKGTETSNYFIVGSGSISTAASTETATSPGSGRIPIRCKELWIGRYGQRDTAGFTVVAGLTNCKERDFPTLTGSEGFEGIG